MSDFIGAARALVPTSLAGLINGGGWRSALLPASFRGVAFEVADHEYNVKRRVGLYEFPFRDEVFTEDFGRGPRRFTFNAFVVGEDYIARRDALLQACLEDSTAATLVHPTLGEWTVRCEGCSMTETVKDGRLATFAFNFIEVGGEQFQPQQADTVGGLLAGIRKALGLARSAFALVFAAKNLGNLVLRAATSALAGIGERLLGFVGLPGLDLRQVATAIGGLGKADATDPAATAAAVTAPFLALADAATASPAGTVPSGAAGPSALGSTVPTSRGETTPRAFWVGTVVLAAGSAAAGTAGTVATTGLLAGLIAANQAALEALCGDAAVLAATQIWAGTEFASAEEAAAIRETLVVALLARQDAAADAGQDALYAAWRDVLAGLVADDAARGPARPRLRPYRLPAPLNSLALAGRLYGDATRADELVALNGAPHPAFLPPRGLAASPPGQAGQAAAEPAPIAPLGTGGPGFLDVDFYAEGTPLA